MNLYEINELAIKKIGMDSLISLIMLMQYPNANLVQIECFTNFKYIMENGIQYVGNLLLSKQNGYTLRRSITKEDFRIFFTLH